MNFTLDFGPIIAALIPLIVLPFIKSDGKSVCMLNFTFNLITSQQNSDKIHHIPLNPSNHNNAQHITDILFDSPFIALSIMITVLITITTIAIKWSFALNIATIIALFIFAITYFAIYLKVGDNQFNKLLFITLLLNVAFSYLAIYLTSLSLEIPNNLPELYNEIGFFSLLQDYGSVVSHLITSFFIRLLAFIWLLVGTFEFIFKKIASKLSCPYLLLSMPFLALFLFCFI